MIMESEVPLNNILSGLYYNNDIYRLIFLQEDFDLVSCNVIDSTNNYNVESPVISIDKFKYSMLAKYIAYKNRETFLIINNKSFCLFNIGNMNYIEIFNKGKCIYFRMSKNGNQRS